MSAYRLAALADDDLRGIFWQGIERFGPRQTERYLSTLEEVFEHLGQFPRSGRMRKDVSPPARVYLHGAHVIIYEQDDDGVLILRVRAARENWASALEKKDTP